MPFYNRGERPKKEIALSPQAISRQMLYGNQVQDQTDLKEPCPEPCPEMEKEVKQPLESEITEKEKKPKKAKSKKKEEK